MLAANVQHIETAVLAFTSLVLIIGIVILISVEAYTDSKNKKNPKSTRSPSGKR